MTDEKNENGPEWAKGKEALAAGGWHKFVTPGDSVAGKLLRVETGEFKGKENHKLRMRTKDGIKVVAGTQGLMAFVLDNNLVGKVIGIVYKGDEKTKNNQTFKNFKVFELTAEEAGLTRDQVEESDDLPF